MILRWVAQLVPAVLLGELVWYSQSGAWTVMRIAGFVLIALGLSVMFVARWKLGDSFSVTPQARKLVTGGVYSVLRHPVYVTGIVALAGAAL